MGEKGFCQSLHLQSTTSNPGSVISCLVKWKTFIEDKDFFPHTLPVWCSWASCTKTFLSRETTSMNWVHKMTFSAQSCVISVVAVCRRSSSFSKFYNTIKKPSTCTTRATTRVMIILHLIFNVVDGNKLGLDVNFCLY